MHTLVNHLYPHPLPISRLYPTSSLPLMLFAPLQRGWLLWTHHGIAQPGYINLRRALATAREVATALEYLHSQNVLHGDLNGNNILLCAVPTAAPTATQQQQLQVAAGAQDGGCRGGSTDGNGCFAGEDGSSGSYRQYACAAAAGADVGDDRGFTAKVGDFGLSRLLTPGECVRYCVTNACDCATCATASLRNIHTHVTGVVPALCACASGCMCACCMHCPASCQFLLPALLLCLCLEPHPLQSARRS